MSAMRMFLSDYESGKKENRYICHELPKKLPYSDKTFDIGLSSHFLLMYTMLGYDFHIFVQFSGLVTADKVVKLAIQEAKKEKICMRLRKQI